VLIFWVDFFPVDFDRAFAMFSPLDQGADNNGQLQDFDFKFVFARGHTTILRSSF